MTGTLNVYLYTTLIGHLTQDEHGQTLFEYTREWLTNANAIPLSLSLPLQEEKFGEKQCKPFFAGVLPDIAKRKLIAQNLGISTSFINYIGFTRKIFVRPWESLLKENIRLREGITKSML
jgi:HipA-like protein